MTIEQVSAFLREVPPDDRLARDTLRVAIEWIVPHMAPETILWIVPMLRDLAISASCRGDDFCADRMQTAALALEEVCSGYTELGRLHTEKGLQCVKGL